MISLGLFVPMFFTVIQDNIESDQPSQIIIDGKIPPINDNIETKANFPPTLLSPASGSEFKDRTPDLDWSDVFMADSYHIQVARDSGFTNLVVDINTPISEYTCLTLTDDLYYWHVQTYDFLLEYGAYCST